MADDSEWIRRTGVNIDLKSIESSCPNTQHCNTRSDDESDDTYNLDRCNSLDIGFDYHRRNSGKSLSPLLRRRKPDDHKVSREVQISSSREALHKIVRRTENVTLSKPSFGEDASFVRSSRRRAASSPQNDLNQNIKRCESLPLCHRFQVEGSSKYLSLLFNVIQAKNYLGRAELRKISTTEVPAEKIDFYKRMKDVIRKDFQEPVFNLKQKSVEEVLYQQELSDIIWLELQSYLAQEECHDFDVKLCIQRQKVGDVVEKVKTFKFAEEDGSYQGSDKESSTKSASEWGKPARCNSSNDCSGCLSIWCMACRDRETEALKRIANLLEIIQEVELLFPSSKALAQQFPLWKDQEFQRKYKSLCVWYNMTNQFRLKIELLGRRLGHMTKTEIPWPSFPSQYQLMPLATSSEANLIYCSSDGDDESEADEYCVEEETEDSMSEYNSAQSAEDEVQTKPCVKFKLEAATNVSNVNSSTDSGHISASNSCFEVKSNSALLSPDSHELQSSLSCDSLKLCNSSVFYEANPYRRYVEKILRNKSLKKTLDKVREVISDVMDRAIHIFQLSGAKHFSFHVMVKYDDESYFDFSSSHSLIHTFDDMTLPPIYAPYLFLLSVPSQIVRECLRLRIEQMPSKPSQLSFKQLLYEYKESIKTAMKIKEEYISMCQMLTPYLNTDLAEDLEHRQTTTIEDLHSNLKKMFEVYLSWLDEFVLILYKGTNINKKLKYFLQDEWQFVQTTCSHFTEGESLAASKFCVVACGLFCRVNNFITEHMDNLEESMNMPVRRETDCSPELENVDDMQNSVRRVLNKRCRSIQEIFSEAKERAVRATGLAKMLRQDLEIAAEFEFNDEPQSFLDKLKIAGYMRITGLHYCNNLIFVPGNMHDNSDAILRMLELKVPGPEESPGDFSLDEHCGCFILVQRPRVFHWKGKEMRLQMTLEGISALSRIKVSDIIIVVSKASYLRHVRREFMTAVATAVRPLYEYCAPFEVVNNSLKEMKKMALSVCDTISENVKKAEDLLRMSDHPPESDTSLLKQSQTIVRDTLNQIFVFGFDYCRAVSCLFYGNQRFHVVPVLSLFGQQWITFVRNYYPSGRRHKPRWASQGLEYLLFLSEPTNTFYLEGTPFKEFSRQLEDCSKYIFGSETSDASSHPTTPVSSRKPKLYSYSSTTSQGSQPGQYSSAAASPELSHRSSAVSGVSSSSQRSDIEVKRSDCFKAAIDKLEKKLDRQKMKNHMIGKLSAKKLGLNQIKTRVVGFSWIRGLKIGAGRFGKVYTAVNNNSGELMAVKVIPLHPSDYESIRKVTDELHIFEGIHHTNLVRHYGFEIHDDEMFIFMEFCSEGTLEALTSSTETGLSEALVRKYTRQLLEAVRTLHEHGIVHRDIKGANIFLTQDGNILKLGDFGSAARLRGPLTEVGELAGIVGTHAYMAPEIYSSKAGQGRASDVWSVGCVVIEMGTGKRPWPEYDSSVQIMYRMCSGQKPNYPAQFSEEGHDFLNQCFIHDPKKRATALNLLDHSFVKFEVSEEYPSLPYGCSASSFIYSSDGM